MIFSKDIKLYIVLLFLAFGYKILEWSHEDLLFLHSYLEDLIALPILLKTSLLVVQTSNRNWRNLILENTEVIAISLVFAVYFEVALPLYDDRFTSDPMDILCYFAGAWFYQKYLNRMLAEDQKNNL